MRNPLRIPRVLKDTAGAIEASLPHARRAADTKLKALELLREAEDPGSGLGESERAALRARVDELWAQTRRENEAAERPYEELKARHPDWVQD
jgi:hypothetical protein